jgi:D-glycero-D-manno-heptose 1,7-bisphosphate phosphatase
LSLKNVYLVGDTLRDLQAAAAAGARPALVLTNYGRRTISEGGLPEGTQIFADLSAFADHLLAQHRLVAR